MPIYDWGTFVIGNGIPLASADNAEWICFYSDFALERPEDLVNCNEAIDLAIAAVPVPAALWLFGSALGFAAWWRRTAISSDQD